MMRQQIIPPHYIQPAMHKVPGCLDRSPSDCKRSGHRMAMLTNNVQEWEPLWRTMLPVDEIFELVIDSGWVGYRKPERQIYEITLERLGLPATACLFVDDLEVNIEAARELGMRAVHFRDNEQATSEIRAALPQAPPP